MVFPPTPPPSSHQTNLHSDAGRCVYVEAPGRLTRRDAEDALRGDGLAFSVGPYDCRIRSPWPSLVLPLLSLYADAGLHRFDIAASVVDIDAVISAKRAGFVGRSDAEFSVRGFPPLPELPPSQVHPLFEWGLNWAVATLSGTEIVIHAAIVERGGTALVLPGEPGAGKSTLCAALALSGWRLLSDELTIIDIGAQLAIPVPRPISLKGRSIDVISRRFPAAWLTEPITETRKGAISYVRPPTEAYLRVDERPQVGGIVFPAYRDGAALNAVDVSPGVCLPRLIVNTFNVGLIGHPGFEILAATVARARCVALEYSNIDDALGWIDRNFN